MGFYELFQEEVSNTNQLWQIFVRNCLTDHFKRSRQSAYAMFLIPCTVNMYYAFRTNILINVLRVSSIITTVSIWHYCMNRDFEDFVKLDTVDSNLARKYIQNISKKNVIFPYFEKETMEIIQKRQEQEKEK
ncbi:hypothetical protein pb186bvf_001159 [Paramecium bursaria]